MNKLVLAGFPCTEFSIAQNKNRINKIDFTADEFLDWKNSTPKWWNHIDEFERQIGEKLGVEDYKFALGLQLFFNCLVVLDKLIADGHKPYYLFENVSSMKKEIKQVMTKIFVKGYGGGAIEINSALVSAQNRKRIYFHNFGEIPQPEDRGILLRDVLEVTAQEKGYCLGEPAAVNLQVVGRKRNEFGEFERHYEARTDGKASALTAVEGRRMVAEPVRIGTIEHEGETAHDSQQYRVYSPDGKSVTLCGQGGGVGAKTGLYAVPIDAATFQTPHGFNDGGIKYDKAPTLAANGSYEHNNHIIVPPPTNLSEKEVDYLFRNPKRVNYGYIQNADNDKAKCITANISKGVPYNVMFQSTDGKSTTLCGQGGDVGAKMGLYAVPLNPLESGKARPLTASYYKKCTSPNSLLLDAFPENPNKQIFDFIAERSDGKTYPVYEVCSGYINIKGELYEIKLTDGYYIIRKLTVTECCRLQTLPDSYYELPIFMKREVVLKCKDVPSMVVTLPFLSEKQDSAINIKCVLSEAALLSQEEHMSTRHCLARQRVVQEIDKQLWDIVCSTISVIKDGELPISDIYATKNQFIKYPILFELTESNITYSNIEKLLEQSREKLCITSILMAKIIASVIYTSQTIPSIQKFTQNSRALSSASLLNCGLFQKENCINVECCISMAKPQNIRLISDTQAYRCCGNGWTAEVIKHILKHANIPLDEEITVVSMYDGIATGRYCLDILGYENVQYHSWEIDKYAIQIATKNYPDITHHGDAFQVRGDDWGI